MYKIIHLIKLNQIESSQIANYKSLVENKLLIGIDQTSATHYFSFLIFMRKFFNRDEYKI